MSSHIILVAYVGFTEKGSPMLRSGSEHSLTVKCLHIGSITQQSRPEFSTFIAASIEIDVAPGIRTTVD